jgi:hypothetical protein
LGVLYTAKVWVILSLKSLSIPGIVATDPSRAKISVQPLHTKNHTATATAGESSATQRTTL